MSEETKKGKFTIQLVATDYDDCPGYSIDGDNNIWISIDQGAYEKFEANAKKFTGSVADALAHALLKLLKGDEW